MPLKLDFCSMAQHWKGWESKKHTKYCFVSYSEMDNIYL